MGAPALHDGDARLTRLLGRAPAAALVAYAGAAAFATYFCMYAFRKPFVAASFEGQKFLGSDILLKTALAISQVIGYTVSKYVGIKLCSEATGARRAWLLLGMILFAEASLFAFGVLWHDQPAREP